MHSLSVLDYSSEWLFTTFILMSLLLNTCLSIDLYLTVKNPFAKASGRTITFTVLTVIIVLTMMAAYILSWFGVISVFSSNSDSDSEILLLLSVFIVYVVTSIFTLVSAMRKLLKPGLSREVRKTVVARQIRYIFTIVVFFTGFFFTKSLISVLDLELHHLDWINFVGTLLFCMLPMVLSLYRLTEPIFWRSFKNFLRYVICCGGEAKSAQTAETETILTFLATSYNVELVYIILKGITSFSKEQNRIEQGKKSSLSNIKRSVKSSKITVDRIKIKNPEAWDVMTAEDMQADAG